MSSMITIDKRFEKSVNLFFDLGNKEKIESYIFTSASKNIMNQYFSGLEYGSKDRVSMLIGPYGKGKSHLLLVLLDRLEHLDRPYLPVLISYGQQDLKQEFLLGLERALEHAGIQDIKPDSYYAEAVRLILMWKNKYKETYRNMEKLLGKNNTTAEKLLESLNKYSDSALELFQNIYPELTSGSTFEPLIRTDLKENFISINRQLSEKYGYNGMFVVFDEFGKYIEGHGIDGYENDMKVLQDMCELAVKSEEPQFHLTMVTHKSIKEYGDTVDKRIMDGFRGIEGRIREIFYIDSIQNHYELISNVIKKDKKKFEDKIVNGKESIYKSVVAENGDIPYFKTLFSKEYFEKIIGRGCYPLTPIASYLLLIISQKIAQNERTLFTFLAGQDVNGLGSLIRTKGEESYLGGEVVYDYFENVFREEVNNVEVHSEWLKAEYALSHTDEKTEQAFIKNVALLHMIHRENEMPSSDCNIRLAMGTDEKSYEQIKEALIEKNLIAYRGKSKMCRLKNSIGIDVEDEILRVQNETASNISWRSILEKISEMQYELPKRYNSQYKMTRFFQYEFFSVREFQSLKTFKYLFDEKFADGKIILLLEHTDSNQIKSILQDIDDERVIVINPKQDFDGQALLKRYDAIERLKLDEEFINSNKVVLTELELYQQDIYFEINAGLEHDYLPENGNCDIYSLNGAELVESAWDFNRLLSDICDSYYGRAPKINHELINRNHISAQIRKARGNLLGKILLRQDMDGYLTGTSAEATIYRAVVLNTQDDLGTREMKRIIRKFVYSSAGTKRGFEKLYDELQGKDFGIRKGIIPLYIAEVLIDLNDLPIIYCLGKEVEISEDILGNIDMHPEDYSLYLEKSTLEKEKYLLSLKKLYHVDAERNVLNGIINQMLVWYRSLPQHSCSGEEGLSRQQIKFRNLLRGQDKNAGELLFKDFPDAFQTESFAEIFENIKSTKEILDTNMDRIYGKTCRMVKKAFDGTDGDDLHNLLKRWRRSSKDYINNHICSSYLTGLYEYAGKINGYEDKAIVSDLSKLLTDTFPENWGDNSYDKFAHKLNEVLEEVSRHGSEEDNGRKIRFVASDGKVIEKSYTEVEEDGTGTFLKNAIEDALEEFDGVIDNAQKVAILVQTLERVIRNG